MEDYPDLRNWLFSLEWFENYLHKSPYTVTINDDTKYTPKKAVELHNILYPSLLVITVDGQYALWGDYIYNNWQNKPCEEILSSVKPYYLIF